MRRQWRINSIADTPAWARVHIKNQVQAADLLQEKATLVPVTADSILQDTVPFPKVLAPADTSLAHS